MAFHYAIKHALKNGKNGVKNGAKAVVNGNGNGYKNGVKELSGGDLAKQQFVKANTKIPEVTKPTTFEVDRISDEFAPFMNFPARRRKGIDRIPDREASAQYTAEGKEYWAKHGNLNNFRRYVDAETGISYKLRDGSKFNKDGTRVVKTRNETALAEEHAERKRWEREQSHGKTDRSRVHHRFELSFLDRIANGLGPSQRRKFFEMVHNDERWPNLRTGNQDVNMIGAKKDKTFKAIHTDIHKLLAMAGLDPDTVDFKGATMAQRIKFLDEVAPILDQIDQFIFNQTMAGKYPDQFTAFKI